MIVTGYIVHRRKLGYAAEQGYIVFDEYAEELGLFETTKIFREFFRFVLTTKNLVSGDSTKNHGKETTEIFEGAKFSPEI